MLNGGDTTSGPELRRKDMFCSQDRQLTVVNGLYFVLALNSSSVFNALATWS